MGAQRIGRARGCVTAGIDRGVGCGPGFFGASVPRARRVRRNTAETSEERASERRALGIGPRARTLGYGGAVLVMGCGVVPSERSARP